MIFWRKMNFFFYVFLKSFLEKAVFFRVSKDNRKLKSISCRKREKTRKIR